MRVMTHMQSYYVYHSDTLDRAGDLTDSDKDDSYRGLRVDPACSSILYSHSADSSISNIDQCGSASCYVACDQHTRQL